jgi:hypothetical protein
MAVQQRVRLRERRQRQPQPPGGVFAGEELFDQERAVASLAAASPSPHDQEFVAQRQQARRLETDDRRAARHVRRQRGDDTLRLHASRRRPVPR